MFKLEQILQTAVFLDLISENSPRKELSVPFKIKVETSWLLDFQLSLFWEEVFSCFRKMSIFFLSTSLTLLFNLPWIEIGRPPLSWSYQKNFFISFVKKASFGLDCLKKMRRFFLVSKLGRSWLITLFIRTA